MDSTGKRVHRKLSRGIVTPEQLDEILATWSASDDVRERGRAVIGRWLVDNCDEIQTDLVINAADSLIKVMWDHDLVTMIRADLDGFIAGIVESYENLPEEE